MDALHYTKASALFSGAPDPWNPAEEKERWVQRHSAAVREATLANDGVAGGFYKAAKGVVTAGVNALAMGLPLVQAIEWLWGLIADAVNRMSHGGFDDLSLLTRQRLYLQMPGWGRKKPSKYTSQSPVGAVDSDGVLWRSSIDLQSESEFARSLRNYLIGEAQKQEFRRITQTSDEPILPNGAIVLLNEQGLYPPPIEPMPLTRNGWLTTYRGYDRWYSYSPPVFGAPDRAPTPVEPRPVTHPAFKVPPAGAATIAPTRRSVLATAVAEQLQAEYTRDARAYSAAVGELGLVFSGDLLALIERTQMAPRYGSAANPPQPTTAPRNRAVRM